MCIYLVKDKTTVLDIFIKNGMGVGLMRVDNTVYLFRRSPMFSGNRKAFFGYAA